MRRCFRRYDLGNGGIAINGGRCAGNDFTRWNLAHAQHNICDKLPADYHLEFLKKRRFQKRELMHPDTVVHQQVEFFVANLVGPGVRCNGFTDDGSPVAAYAVFEQLGFEAQTTSQPFEDARERIQGTESAHGGILAKTSWKV
jgi:hypothetical protein